MKLWRSYSERVTGTLRPRYGLTVRLEVTAEERAIIDRHALHDDELWAGPAALEADASAESALDLARHETDWDAKHTAKAITLKSKGIWTALVTANREARITVDQLIEGRTFEADDVVELQMAWGGIKSGTDALKAKLATLKAYDEGFEDLTGDDARDEGVPPSDWGRFAKS